MVRPSRSRDRSVEGPGRMKATPPGRFGATPYVHAPVSSRRGRGDSEMSSKPVFFRENGLAHGAKMVLPSSMNICDPRVVERASHRCKEGSTTDCPLVDSMQEQACDDKLVVVLHTNGLACPTCREKTRLGIRRRY